ncbi:MAG TPA: response regulator transcription factor [Spirochaetia bacterium]|nr:response regulator transcription factor [Spirochaetia bacterium]
MSLKHSFIVVDDHPLYRHGVVTLIVQELHLEAVGEASSIPEALDILQKKKPDLAIVDISLQEKNGLELVSMIRNQYPQVKVLVVSMHEESLYGERSLSAGAMGYVMKHESPAKLLQAVRTVLEGKVAVSEALRERMLAGLVGGRHEREPVDRLSNRELEVFRFIGHGYGAAEIAEMLHLSVKTVNAYRDHIKEKFNLNSAADLRRYAVEWIAKKDIS